jgi:hypothetical protein
MEEVRDSFCCGTMYGLIVGGIIGLTLHQIREARTKMGLKNRPLDNFPDAAQPQMTSSGVVNTSQQATVRYVMWTFFLIVFVVAVIAGVLYVMDWVF